MPIVKASKRDTTVLEALTCAWQPEAAAWQLTMVWSDEAMPRSRLSLGLKDALYRAMRLLRCVHLRKRAHPFLLALMLSRAGMAACATSRAS